MAATKSQVANAVKTATPKVPATDADMRKNFKNRANKTLATLKRATGSASRLQRGKGIRPSDAQRTAYHTAVRAYVEAILASLEPITSAAVESTIPDA